MADADTGAGLCGRCAHARRIRNDRGSTFWLCDLSVTDRRYPRYPVLPVLACRGFRAAGAAGPPASAAEAGEDADDR